MKQNLVIIIASVLLGFSLQTDAQNSRVSDLYKQRSEMDDMMIQFDSDRSSIMRFYTTSGSGDEWWLRQQRSDYNSPERRQRLMELTTDYLGKIAIVDFDKMNINGKVDYLLFKRNLEDTRY